LYLSRYLIEGLNLKILSVIFLISFKLELLDIGNTLAKDTCKIEKLISNIISFVKIKIIIIINNNNNLFLKIT
jgi:hypothetical protein